MRFTKTELRRLTNVLEAETNNFKNLVAVAGLRPELDFRDADLRGVDFSTDDYREFDFRGADLRNGANFSRAQGLQPSMFVGSRRDESTRLPDGMSDAIELEEQRASKAKPRQLRLMRRAELVDRVKAYYPEADETVLNGAYDYAMKAYAKHFGASGEPHFAHPVEVAAILTELRADVLTIATALLHDIIEYEFATSRDIEAVFGKEIANLVDGVTRLSQLEIRTGRIREVRNVRKLLGAGPIDIRVLLVKLADRLHTMRTPHDSSLAEILAEEGRNVYAPMAGCIGMRNLREEMENIAFAELDPERYNYVVTLLRRCESAPGPRIGRTADEIKRCLEAAGIQAWVYGKFHPPFSIWRQMQSRKLNIDSLSDMVIFRIIVGTQADCYRVRKILQSNWREIRHRFRDYIESPKWNGYRSLHLKVIGPFDEKIEIQVCTQEMHEANERGIASYWDYASGSAPSANIRALRNWPNLLADLWEGKSKDLFENETDYDHIVCYTPKGDEISLPAGATPIDFAYAVHVDLGNSIVQSKINGIQQPLNAILSDGDEVEVVRTKAQSPSRLWQKFAVTTRARDEIARFLKKTEFNDHVELGNKWLRNAFEQAQLHFTNQAPRRFMKKLDISSVEEFYYQVGSGLVLVDEILKSSSLEKKESLLRDHKTTSSVRTKRKKK